MNSWQGAKNSVSGQDIELCQAITKRQYNERASEEIRGSSNGVLQSQKVASDLIKLPAKHACIRFKIWLRIQSGKF